MNIIKYISVIIAVVTLLFMNWNIYLADCQSQERVLDNLVNINTTIIGFLITLIGIIAAIRNVTIVNDYMNDHGNKFKRILYITMLSGLIAIILILTILSLIYMPIRNLLLILMLVSQIIFLLSCILIISNMIDMIFIKQENRFSEEDAYK
ncbi:hypothetical protein WN59_06735 [Salinicoccus sediminis]|uniref:Uncharacterized protein n=1 Tax=Salinicoccus sediminis TaxID=1432562 RepID=A0A0M2SJ47_9STAP|nr:hypothetical protein WN59_06735 [Salinicoccus sediminis]